MLQHVADVVAAKIGEQVGIPGLPCGRDVVGLVLRSRPKRELSTLAGSQHHGQQLEQCALAGAAFADECELGAGHDIELRYLETELGAAGLVALHDPAQGENGITQGSASSSSG